MKGSWRAGGWNRKYLENRLWNSLLLRVADISDFARPNSNKAVLLQISLRFEVVIFNNNFIFYVAGFLDPVMSSFCSMSWVASWILLRELIKRTSVFQPVCLKNCWKKLDKHLWRGLFCKNCPITHHSLLKVNQTLLEIWRKCWLKYEKVKKTEGNIKENLFQIIANELYKLQK